VSLASGTAFGPYRILDPLGRGGMATVYKAYEAGLDRYVALKILPSEFLHDEGFAERFRREAKVIARLEHPNIIPIHNFGIEEQSHTPWMAMRLVSGGALSTIMKKARLGSDRAITILRGVAEALDYAHGKGVVHRDIKPQNILLDEAERVYLADFGIAKMVAGSSGLTQTGMISGTPQYMAPEQAMAGTVDHRADIYALGIVAYEMLTGRVPFAADTPVAVLMKHVQEPIPIPSTRDVPEPLMRALLKALAKRPDDRWPSAVAFVNALGEALAQVSTGAGMVATPTAFLPTEPATPMPAHTPRGTPAAGTAAAGTPARGTRPGMAGQATPYPGTRAMTPGQGTPHPGTPGGGTPYPQAVGAPYPGTPPVGTPYPPPYAPPGYAPGYPPPPYQTGTYPGGPPTYPPPGPGGGRGLVVGLVAAVVFAGILATAVLILLLRTRTDGVPPERSPVTLRAASPATAEAALGASTVPEPTTLVAAPATTVTVATPPARPSPSPRTPRTAAATLAPARVAEVAPPPPALPTPAPAEPARSLPAPATFPGAGKTDMGEKFYEKTLAYAVGPSLPFEAQVGPVKVPMVQFFVSPNKRRFGRKDEQHQEVRAVFPVVDCPRGAGEWDYKMIVELLDESGHVLHKFADSGSCKNEIKTTAAYDAVANVLIPSIRGVKVRLEASKD